MQVSKCLKTSTGSKLFVGKHLISFSKSFSLLSTSVKTHWDKIVKATCVDNIKL